MGASVDKQCDAGLLRFHDGALEIERKERMEHVTVHYAGLCCASQAQGALLLSLPSSCVRATCALCVGGCLAEQIAWHRQLLWCCCCTVDATALCTVYPDMYL